MTSFRCDIYYSLPELYTSLISLPSSRLGPPTLSPFKCDNSKGAGNNGNAISLSLSGGLSDPEPKKGGKGGGGDASRPDSLAQRTLN